jgi:hypothetical protein
MISPGDLQMRCNNDNRTVQAFRESRWEMSADGGGGGKGQAEKILQLSERNG